MFGVTTMHPRWALLLAVLALGATACTSDQHGTPPKPVSITIDVPARPATFDPTRGYAPDGAGQFYDGLLEHRADRRLQPALATEVPQPDAGGTHWIATVRTSATFANGAHVRPADVVATYRATLAADPARLPDLRAVEAVGKNQVRFTLTHPDPEFDRELVLGIAPASAIRAGTLGTHPVGAGPFALAGRHGDELTLRARSDYWDGKPKIDRVTVRFQPDQRQRLADVRAGRADAALVSNDQRANPPDGTSVVTASTAAYLAVTLPKDHPVTGDATVRRAMNLATDRGALVAGPLGGVGAPAETPFTNPEYQDPQAHFTGGPDQARRLLDQHGWRVGANGLRAKDGQTAAFRLRYPTTDAEAGALAQNFADQMRRIGIRVTPVPGQGDGDEATLTALGDPFTPVLGPDVSDPVAFRVRLAQQQTTDSQRSIAYRAADRSYLDDPNLVVLARPEHTYLVADRLRGYQPVLDPAKPGLSWGLFALLKDWSVS